MGKERVENRNRKTHVLAKRYYKRQGGLENPMGLLSTGRLEICRFYKILEPEGMGQNQKFSFSSPKIFGKF